MHSRRASCKRHCMEREVERQRKEQTDLINIVISEWGLCKDGRLEERKSNRKSSRRGRDVWRN